MAFVARRHGELIFLSAGREALGIREAAFHSKADKSLHRSQMPQCANSCHDAERRRSNDAALRRGKAEADYWPGGGGGKRLAYAILCRLRAQDVSAMPVLPLRALAKHLCPA